MKKKSIRIKELAEALGLSQGTISIVLNGRGDEMRISKATQKKVLEGAKEMGYEPTVRSRRRQGCPERGDRLTIAVYIPYIPEAAPSICSSAHTGSGSWKNAAAFFPLKAATAPLC